MTCKRDIMLNLLTPKVCRYIWYTVCFFWVTESPCFSQKVPITSSAGQKYPMPMFDLNKKSDSAYINTIVKKAHSLMALEQKKQPSLLKDSTILRLYNYLGSVYRETPQFADSCLYYGKKMVEYARAHGNLEFEVKGLFQQAHYYQYVKNNLSKSLNVNLEAFKLLEDASHDPQVFWRVCFNLGELYKKIDEYDKALKYLQLSDTLIKSGTGLSTVATEAHTISIWLGIANIYREKKLHTDAEEYFRKVLSKLDRISFLSFHANSFFEYANYLRECKKYKEALYYYKKATEIWENSKDPKSANVAKSYLALVYNEVSEPDSAKKYAESVIESSTKTLTARKNAHFVLYSLNNKTGSFENAISHFRQHIILRDSLDKLSQKESLYKVQSKYEIERLETNNARLVEINQREIINAKAKRLIDSLKSSSELQRYQDELERERLTRQLETQKLQEKAIIQNAANYRRFTDQKNFSNSLQINKLNLEKTLQGRTRNFLIAGLILTIVTVSLLLWLNRKLRKKNHDLLLKNQLVKEVTQKIQDVEIAALRSQMNPHFIFNCLNSIKLYTLENDSNSASEYLTKFSRLIRLVLENSRTEMILLEKEIEALNLYIEMEIMRFKGKLQYELHISKNVDIMFTEIPPLLLQPFVENAIWHGLMHKEEGGKVKVNICQKEEGYLQVEIRDNGIGRKQSQYYKSKTAIANKSFGMKVTSERIDLINKIYKTDTRIEIIDLIDAHGEALGTKVILRIPV